LSPRAHPSGASGASHQPASPRPAVLGSVVGIWLTSAWRIKILSALTRLDRSELRLDLASRSA